MSTVLTATWPSFSEEEADAAYRVIASNRVNYWTGEECRRFEEEFAAWTGSAKAVALANGTLALDVALRALDIGPGDEVVVTPRTFIASVSAVVNAGATPIFADVNRDSGNLDADTIARVLTERTRAIVPVHLGGWPCDMTAIGALARAHGLSVIEDCAQAHGARHRGRSVGTFGEIGAWSFCQDKIMTTGGEGGMVTTDDTDLWSRMWSFKDHGKSFDAVYHRTHEPGYRWVHENFGTNWRMLEVQAAIGRIQLRRMDDWTMRRTANAVALLDVLQARQVVRAPRVGPDDVNAYYRVYAYVRPDALADGWSRDRIVDAITARGVPAFQGTCAEVYRERAFDGTGLRPATPLPVAHELGETSLMFLTHPSLSPDDVALMRDVIGDVLQQAQR